MEKMTFVFDLDDTVCDTNAFSDEFITNFFAENKWPFKKITNATRFAEAKFDWDTKTALNWYKVHGDEMMLSFPCKPYAKELINGLYDQGHRIVIATARANDWHTNPEALTKLWLTKNKIKHTKLYIGRVDKEQICEAEEADFFVDDDLKITERVAKHFVNAEHKCQSLLMTSEYNAELKEADGVIRVKDFYDFADLLKDYGINLGTNVQI